MPSSLLEGSTRCRCCCYATIASLATMKVNIALGMCFFFCLSSSLAFRAKEHSGHFRFYLASFSILTLVRHHSVYMAT